MIGNHHCDSECYNEACNWDGLDCGCAPNCALAYYGNCKPECLRPDCAYDSMPGFPNCTNQIQRKATKGLHLISKDFNADYIYEIICALMTPSCAKSLWLASYTACIPECANSYYCGASFGNCKTECPEHCTACYQSDCYGCEAGYILFYTLCLQSCPIWFEPHPLVTDICYYNSSIALTTSSIFYVSNRTNSANTGTAANPFTSLSIAFAAAYTPSVTINILRGTHKLTAVLGSQYLHIFSQENDYDYFLYGFTSTITIRALLCSVETHPECVSGIPPELIFDNLNPVVLRVRGKLVIEGVNLSGRTSLTSGCENNLCVYCPYVILSDGIWIDDRQNPVTDFSAQSLCDSFHSHTLFLIYSGSALTLTNVSITDFRQQFSSLISFSNATLTLNNVTFSNIMVTDAVLKQNGLNLTSIVEIRKGSIELLNNGYEYRANVDYGGFIHFSSVFSLEIDSVMFSFNDLGVGATLIAISDFVTSNIQNCIFQYNLGQLISVTSTISLPRTLNSNNGLTYFNITHFSVVNSTFEGNSGNFLVSVLFSGDIQNVEIQNCTFHKDLSLSSGLLSIESSSFPLQYETSGSTLGVISFGKRYQVLFPSTWVELMGLSFTSCSVYGDGLISLQNLANVIISSIELARCGDIGPNQTVSETTLSYFGSNPEIYMSLLIIDVEMSACSSLIFVTSISGLLLSNSNFRSNACNSGSGGVVSVNTQGTTEITNCSFEMITSSSGLLGTALDLSASGVITITNLNVLNCHNSAGNGNGIVRLQSVTDVTYLSESTFSFNTFSSGGALHCIGSFSISSSKFISNASAGTTAAGLVYEPLVTAPMLRLFSLLFLNNTSDLGGAFSLHDSSIISTPIQLQIDSSAFTSNTGVRLGACVYIAQTVKFSNSSSISKSTFQNNYSGVACFNSAFQSGTLTIDSCLFRNNTGVSYSVLYNFNSASQIGIKAKLILLNTVVEYNEGTYTIGFYNIGETKAETRNLTFQYNRGEGFLLQFAILTDYDSVFQNNSSPSLVSAFSAALYSTASFTNTKFIGNANIMGPAIYIGGASAISFTNCDFIENFSEVGASIFIDEISVLYIHSCRFLRNKSATFGPAINLFIESVSVLQTIINTTFVENESSTGTLKIFMANVEFINCSFYSNKADIYPGMLMYLSEVSITGCTFHDQSGEKGTFIAAPTDSLLTVTGSVFYNGASTGGGVAILASSSQIIINQCVFFNLTAPYGAVLSITSDSYFSVFQCEFMDLSALTENGGVIYTTDSIGELNAAQFTRFQNGAIVAERSTISVVNSSFSGKRYSDGNSQLGSAIYCSDCQHVSFLSSLCARLEAKSGSCLYLMMRNFEALYIINNSTFESNVGSNIGAVYINNANAQLIESHFFNNTVTESSGDGGGVYLACYDKANGCSVNITHCIFAYNSAPHNGGAIVWTRSKPVITNTTFSSNLAGYGNNVASFPIRLDATSRQLSELTNIASGQVINEMFSVSLLDHYGHTVVTDNSSTAEIIPSPSTNTTITGQTRVVASSGVFTFTSFEVINKPNSNTSITIQTNGINNNSNLDGIISSQLSISVELRACIAGESLIASMCYVCPEGKYSLDPSGACLDCPTGAVCYGKTLILPTKGYWRANSYSDKFWKCPNVEACLGSSTELTNLSLTGKCATGYYGNMCNGCVSGYSRSSRASCSQCPSQYVNFIRIIGVSLLVILAVIFLIKMNLLSAQTPRSQFSIYFKIFLNYIQLVTITTSFNLSWPPAVLELFHSQSNAGNINDQILSFDCFMDSGKEDNMQTVVYTKIIVLACSPLFIVAVSLLVWFIISLCRCSFTYFRVKLVNSIVIMFFIAHPSIVKSMFDIINCTEINPGEYWLTSFLNIQCWNSEHKRYAYIVALPSIILWGVVCPGIILASLIIHRKRLDEVPYRIQFGFVYSGYRFGRHFWEFVILYRKVLLIVLSVFFANISIPIQALCVMLVLLLSFALQYRYTPFHNTLFNKLEQRAILVSVTTIYCGLFYMADGIDGTTQFVLFVVIVTVNAYFLCYWLLFTARAGCVILRQILVKTYHLLNLAVRRNYEIPNSSPPDISGMSEPNIVPQNSYSIEQGRVFVVDSEINHFETARTQKSRVNSNIIPVVQAFI